MMQRVREILKSTDQTSSTKMKQIIPYLILLLVAALSIVMVFAIPIDSTWKSLAGIPGIAAMASILIQFARDDSAHRRNLEIQSKKEEFDVAITSHMANTAFDKHVEFCDEYLNQMNIAMIELFRKGVCEEMLSHAAQLYQIKVKFRTWLTSDIESELLPFEKALRIIGANAHFYNSSPAEAVDSGAVKESHKVLKEIFGYHKDGSKENNEIKQEAVIQRVRAIIGIEELTKLRYKKIGRSA